MRKHTLCYLAHYNLLQMKVFHVGQALLPWRETKSHKEIRTVLGLVPVIQSIKVSIMQRLESLCSCLSKHSFQSTSAMLSIVDWTAYISAWCKTDRTPRTHKETIVSQLKKENKNQSDTYFQVVATLSYKIRFWEEKAALWP